MGGVYFTAELQDQERAGGTVAGMCRALQLSCRAVGELQLGRMCSSVGAQRVGCRGADARVAASERSLSGGADAAAELRGGRSMVRMWCASQLGCGR